MNKGNVRDLKKRNSKGNIYRGLQTIEEPVAEVESRLKEKGMKLVLSPFFILLFP